MSIVYSLPCINLGKFILTLLLTTVNGQDELSNWDNYVLFSWCCWWSTMVDETVCWLGVLTQFLGDNIWCNVTAVRFPLFLLGLNQYHWFEENHNLNLFGLFHSCRQGGFPPGDVGWVFRLIMLWNMWCIHIEILCLLQFASSMFIATSKTL